MVAPGSNRLLVARFTTQVNKTLKPHLLQETSNVGGKAVVARFLLLVLL